MDKGRSFGARAGPPAWDSHWDRTKSHLGWAFVALAGKRGFGWMQHPWVASCSCQGGGDIPFAALLPSSAEEKGQKMEREGAEEGCEPAEREAERSKAQAMESDNLNSCVEGLSLQAN